MNEIVIFIIGAFISNVIITSIIYHFSKEHYNLAYDSKKIYIISYILIVVGRSALNFVRLPILNIVSCMVLVFISSFILFTSDTKKGYVRYLEVTILVLILMICESIGILLIKYLFPFRESSEFLLFSCFNMIFSMFIVAFMYYVIISKIWGSKREYIIHYIPSQYFINIILTLFSLLNIVLIYFLLPLMNKNIEKIILLMIMVASIIIDLFLLYFMRYTGVNEKLRTKLKLLEQQAELKYNYYNRQEKKYEEFKRIFHDVNKHINMIEELYNLNEQQRALEYTKEINLLLNPLVQEQFTAHVILNILLNEKKNQAINMGIKISFFVGEINMDFMKPIEITTIFGNLLENAIESCEKIINGDKFISLEIEGRNKMIIVSMKNSCTTVNIQRKSKAIYTKSKHYGIGILNIKTIIHCYDGYIAMKEENNVFYSNLFWNSSIV